MKAKRNLVHILRSDEGVLDIFTSRKVAEKAARRFAGRDNLFMVETGRGKHPDITYTRTDGARLCVVETFVLKTSADGFVDE